MSTTDDLDNIEPGDLAIVGMSGRFPGAGDVGEFWANLRGGVESIKVLGEEDLVAAGVPREVWERAGYVRAAARFEGMDWFDAEFFGYSVREAQIMDPQHRVFLEEAWHALEDAGHDPARFEGSIGVFAGSGTSSYLENIYTNLDHGAAIRGENVGLGFELGFLATRVAYKLDLTGPSYPVQTACSTSLVALHAARQSLLGYECDMALAGAVAYKVPADTGYHATAGGFASLDGHVRPFDAGASGTVFGSGVGVVVLRRLEDALADGDHVYAVVRGSAVNNDGAGKVSFTAPSVDGQARVVSAALADAGLVAADVDYVEAHGTGTLVGDAIEMQALSRVFRGEPGQWGVGSLKGNVGHLDAAAGMAGLFKVVLALGHGVMPASLNFERANPDIDLVGGPFRVWSQPRVWRRSAERVRRAGVSAFGFGGTNAHVVVEEAPCVEASSGSGRDGELLVLSARSADGLDRMCDRLASYLEQADRSDSAESPAGAGGLLADVSFTLAVGRRELPFRRVVSGAGAGSVAAALRSRDPGSVRGGQCESDAVGVVFMFTGQGSQYAGMGRELYASERVFAEAFDRCAGLLGERFVSELDRGVGLGEVVFGEPAPGSVIAGLLGQTRWTQPALFAVEYALSELWASWGIEPVASVGHSLGEYVAACRAGVFSLADAVGLVAARGELMQAAPAGLMVSVAAPAELVTDELQTDGGLVSVAAVNSPEDCVVSGATGAVESFVARARDRGWATQMLPGAHGFHSGLMDEVVPAFEEVVAGVSLSTPRGRFVSNVTGTWISDEQATSARYWAEHIRAGVQFARGVECVAAEQGTKVFVEVGPGRTLTTLATRTLSAQQEPVPVVASLPHRQDHRTASDAMRLALGQLWIHGCRPDWDGYFAAQRRHRVPLPGYPFERNRHWLDTATPSVPASEATNEPLTGSTVFSGNAITVRRAVLASSTHWPLDEHRLLGAPLVPGTFYLEMALAAAAEHWQAPVGQLFQVEFLMPLVLSDDEPRVVQLTVRDETSDEATFDVSSARRADAPPSAWTKHATGRARRGRAGSVPQVDLKKLERLCDQGVVDIESLQRDHQNMQFGPRWVESMSRVYLGRGEALANIELPEEFVGDVDEVTLHPALLDLATGFAGLIDRDSAEARSREFHLPLGYESLQFHRPLPARVISHMRLETGSTPNPQLRRCAVDVYDETGASVLTIRGFTTRRVHDAEATLSRSRADRRHHVLEWVPVHAVDPQPDARSGLPTGSRVALLAVDGSAESTPYERELRSVLESAGCDVVAIGSESLSGSLSGIDQVIVLLPSSDQGSDDARASGERGLAGCDLVYAVAQELAAARPAPSHLSVVGRQVRDGSADPRIDSSHAAAFAVAHGAALENDLELLCIAAEGCCTPERVVERLHGPHRPRTVLLGPDSEHVQELRAASTSGDDPGDGLRSFLITGGLGGLGIATALHLARTRPGAKIALLARRELPPREDWAALAAGGTDPVLADLVEIEGLVEQLRVLRADVCDVAAMERVVVELDDAWSGVDCVIHAAGIAGDGFLARKSHEGFRSTLAPKVLGTIVLDHVFRESSPDLMVLFSSTVTVFGAPGQADYAGGNRFEEAYAAERSVRGARTVAIGWSDWLERGMAVDHGVERDLGFFRSLEVRDALESLELLLRSPAGLTTYVGEVNLPRLGAMELDEWRSFADSAPVRLGPELIAAVQARLDAAVRGSGTPAADAPSIRVVGRDSGEYTEFEVKLAALWGTELGLDEIDISASTFELGGDSLTALRIAAGIEKSTGVRISMLDLLQFETVEALAVELARLAAAGDEEGTAQS